MNFLTSWWNGNTNASNETASRRDNIEETLDSLTPSESQSSLTPARYLYEGVSPEETRRNICSEMTYIYLNPTVTKAQTTTLEMEDMLPLDDQRDPFYYAQTAVRKWTNIVDKIKQKDWDEYRASLGIDTRINTELSSDSPSGHEYGKRSEKHYVSFKDEEIELADAITRTKQERIEAAQSGPTTTSASTLIHAKTAVPALPDSINTAKTAHRSTSTIAGTPALALDVSPVPSLSSAASATPAATPSIAALSAFYFESTPPPDSLCDYQLYRREHAGVALARMLLSVLLRDAMSLALVMVVESSNRYLQAMLVGRLIDTVKSYHDATDAVTQSTIVNNGYIYALCMSMSSFFGILFHHYYFYKGSLLGMTIRQLLVLMVHRKTLSLHTRAFQYTTPGQIANLISADVARFDKWGLYSHAIWIGPLQLIVVAFFLYYNIGLLATCMAIVALLVVMPLQTYLGSLFGVIRSTVAAATDKRMKAVREVLQGIRVIKMYGWEIPYQRRIQQLRNAEVAILIKSVWIRAANVALFTMSTSFVGMVTFLTYKLSGGTFSSETVFVTTALLGVARKDLSQRFAAACESTNECWVSLKRVSAFLLLPEVGDNELPQYAKCVLGSDGWPKDIADAVEAETGSGEGIAGTEDDGTSGTAVNNNANKSTTGAGTPVGAGVGIGAGMGVGTLTGTTRMRTVSIGGDWVDVDLHTRSRSSSILGMFTRNNESGKNRKNRTFSENFPGPIIISLPSRVPENQKKSVSLDITGVDACYTLQCDPHTGNVQRVRADNDDYIIGDKNVSDDIWVRVTNVTAAWPVAVNHIDGKGTEKAEGKGKKDKNEGKQGGKDKKNAGTGLMSRSPSPTLSLALSRSSSSTHTSHTLFTNLSLALSRRQFVTIVGEVGSGKSSLCQLFLHELQPACGSVDVRGSVAYVPQQAWLFGGTFRENIICGKTEACLGDSGLLLSGRDGTGLLEGDSWTEKGATTTTSFSPLVVSPPPHNTASSASLVPNMYLPNNGSTNSNVNDSCSGYNNGYSINTPTASASASASNNNNTNAHTAAAAVAAGLCSTTPHTFLPPTAPPLRVRRGGDAWLSTCLHACSLTQDIAQLSHGLDTVVGDKGVTLSGGQKARVSLCRAMYADADIFIIDDVVAALDRGTAVRVLEDAVRTVLRDKLVILSTHHTEVVAKSDYVIWTGASAAGATAADLQGVVWCGSVAHGTPAAMMRLPMFRAMVEAGQQAVELEAAAVADTEGHTEAGVKGVEVGNDRDRRTTSTSSSSSTSSTSGSSSPLVVSVPPRDERMLTIPATHSCTHTTVSTDATNTAATTTTSAAAPTGAPAEARAEGKVSWAVYQRYIAAAGGWAVLIPLVLAGVAVQVCVVSVDLWLVRWVTYDSDASHTPTQGFDYHAQVYVMLVLLLFPLGFTRCYFFLMRFVIAARRIHDSILSRVLQGRVAWFDTHPIGQTLNRFSNDMGQMDDSLPTIVADTIATCLLVLSTVVVVSYHNIYVTVALIPILFFFSKLRSYYMRASQQIKRLESMTKSPIHSLMSSTIDGLAAVRHTPQLAPRMHAQFLQVLRENNRVYVVWTALVRWFGIRLDCLSALFISTTALMAVVMMQHMSSATVGLSLTYVLQLLGFFQWCIRLTADLETGMTAVERVCDLHTIDQERARNRPAPAVRYAVADAELVPLYAVDGESEVSLGAGSTRANVKAVDAKRDVITSTSATAASSPCSPVSMPLTAAALSSLPATSRRLVWTGTLHTIAQADDAKYIAAAQRARTDVAHRRLCRHEEASARANAAQGAVAIRVTSGGALNPANVADDTAVGNSSSKTGNVDGASGASAGPYWPPPFGCVLFYFATLRYVPSPAIPPALHHVCAVIPPGSKVGVVGRTGGGKSTLLSALFRLFELEDSDRYDEDAANNNAPFILSDAGAFASINTRRSGDSGGGAVGAHANGNANHGTHAKPAKNGIFIDGVDISSLGLHDLRQQIAVIPQEPVVFSGTVRSNLDPFGECEDWELVEALRKAQLYHTFFPPVLDENGQEIDPHDLGLSHTESIPVDPTAAPTGLDTYISENGGNLSVGQRQLLCLARALTRSHARLVVLDECTASVDHHTDRIVQQVVREDLSECTLLVVAHRLQTIIDSDLILVMDRGCLVEAGSPWELLQGLGNGGKQGIFRSIVEGGGKDSAAALWAAARESYERKRQEQGQAVVEEV